MGNTEHHIHDIGQDFLQRVQMSVRSEPMRYVTDTMPTRSQRHFKAHPDAAIRRANIHVKRLITADAGHGFEWTNGSTHPSGVSRSLRRGIERDIRRGLPLEKLLERYGQRAVAVMAHHEENDGLEFYKPVNEAEIARHHAEAPRNAGLSAPAVDAVEREAA